MDIEINAKGLTLKQLKWAYNVYKHNHCSNVKDVLLFVTQDFSLIAGFNNGYRNSSAFLGVLQFGAVANDVNKFNINYASYVPLSHQYRTAFHSVSSVTIKSLIKRNILLPLFFHKVSKAKRDTFVLRRYHYLVVNPKIVEWFNLDSQISYFLDTNDEENHKLAYELIKGTTQSFKKFKVPEEEVINEELLKLEIYKKLSAKTVEFLTYDMLRYMHFSIKKTIAMGFDYIDVVNSLGTDSQKNDFYDALEKSLPAKLKSLIMANE